MIALFEQVASIRHNIRGIHLWGKKNSINNRRVAHVGDLKDYLFGNQNIKALFLKTMMIHLMIA